MARAAGQVVVMYWFVQVQAQQIAAATLWHHSAEFSAGMHLSRRGRSDLPQIAAGVRACPLFPAPLKSYNHANEGAWSG